MRWGQTAQIWCAVNSTNRKAEISDVMSWAFSIDWGTKQYNILLDFYCRATLKRYSDIKLKSNLFLTTLQWPLFKEHLFLAQRVLVEQTFYVCMLMSDLGIAADGSLKWPELKWRVYGTFWSNISSACISLKLCCLYKPTGTQVKRLLAYKEAGREMNNHRSTCRFRTLQRRFNSRFKDSISVSVVLYLL